MDLDKTFEFSTTLDRKAIEAYLATHYSAPA